MLSKFNSAKFDFTKSFFVDLVQHYKPIKNDQH